MLFVHKKTADGAVTAKLVGMPTRRQKRERPQLSTFGDRERCRRGGESVKASISQPRSVASAA